MDRIKEHLPDVFKVLGFNSATLGVVTLTNTETVLKIVLLALSIAYTAVKFFHAVKGNEKR